MTVTVTVTDGQQVPASKHRDDIQGLRAVAVLLVALSHAGIGFLKGGFVGVDVFFVLSGFLITGLLLSGAIERRSVSLVDFYARRARRILPAAALTLVATDVVAYRLLNFVRAKQILHDSISASLFTANIHFANQGTDYFAQAQPPSPVQHFWSLAVEEQFYLVWPALLALVLFGVALTRHTRRHASSGVRSWSRRVALSRVALRQQAHDVTDGAVRRLLVAVIVVTLASLSWSIYDTGAHATVAYFSTLTRVWELGLGALLAIGASWLVRAPGGLRTVAGWLGLACIAGAGVMFSSTTPFPGFSALLPTLGAVLVIGAGIGNHQLRLGAPRLLSLAPLRYVGDRSYAFYLWHWPVSRHCRAIQRPQPLGGNKCPVTSRRVPVVDDHVQILREPDPADEVDPSGEGSGVMARVGGSRGPARRIFPICHWQQRDGPGGSG